MRLCCFYSERVVSFYTLAFRRVATPESRNAHLGPLPQANIVDALSGNIVCSCILLDFASLYSLRR